MFLKILPTTAHDDYLSLGGSMMSDMCCDEDTTNYRP